LDIFAIVDNLVKFILWTAFALIGLIGFNHRAWWINSKKPADGKKYFDYRWNIFIHIAATAFIVILALMRAYVIFLT
jgi:hypothetical protein